MDKLAEISRQVTFVGDLFPIVLLTKLNRFSCYVDIFTTIFASLCCNVCDVFHTYCVPVCSCTSMCVMLDVVMEGAKKGGRRERTRE